MCAGTSGESAPRCREISRTRRGRDHRRRPAAPSTKNALPGRTRRRTARLRSTVIGFSRAAPGPARSRAACGIRGTASAATARSRTASRSTRDAFGQRVARARPRRGACASRWSPGAASGPCAAATHSAVSRALPRVSSAAKPSVDAAGHRRAGHLVFGGELARPDVRVDAGDEQLPRRALRAAARGRAGSARRRRSARRSRRSSARPPAAAARSRTTAKPSSPQDDQRSDRIRRITACASARRAR